ncbi:PspC domain-containing protein [Pseudonocardia xinjiangensis]|uniref:PspC domain-containing protein n=1 Tax=Pseudonocardia xinjiangensis TaxID=75289 RepID=UPI003D89B9CA
MEQTTDTTTRVPSAAGVEPPASPFSEQAVPPPSDTVPPTARPSFRLRRSRTDRMIGGVCGGLAESLNMDATLLRIGLVALTVLGAGSGLVIYAAVWMLAPETDTP